MVSSSFENEHRYIRWIVTVIWMHITRVLFSMIDEIIPEFHKALLRTTTLDNIHGTKTSAFKFASFFGWRLKGFAVVIFNRKQAAAVIFQEHAEVYLQRIAPIYILLGRPFSLCETCPAFDRHPLNLCEKVRTCILSSLWGLSINSLLCKAFPTPFRKLKYIAQLRVLSIILAW